MELNSWAGLEHWFYINHVGHYYNTSPQLPNVLYLISTAITYIQCVPILTSVSIISNEIQNPVIRGLQILFDAIVHLTFIEAKPLSAAFFIIMVLISLFAMYCSRISSGRLLLNSTSFILRLLCEFFTPIFFVWSGATTRRLAATYLNGDDNLHFLALSIGATIGYLIIFLFVSYYQSRTLFLRSFLFETWNSTFHYVLIFMSVVLMQVWLIIDANLDHAILIVYVIAAVFNLVLFVFILSVPFIHAYINVVATIVSLFLVLIHISYIILHQYPPKNHIIQFGIVVVLLLISIILAPLIQNKVCTALLKASPNNNESQESHRDSESELENLDGDYNADVDTNLNSDPDNQKQINGRLRHRASIYIDSISRSSSIDGSKKNSKESSINVVFATNENENFALSKFDTYKLRQMFISDRKRSERFATFLLHTTKSKDDKMEAMRILTILKKPPIQNILESTYARLDCQQLLCDMSYEAIARSYTDDFLEEILNCLEVKSLSIKRNISAIAEALQFNNNNNIHDSATFITNYAKECSDFEMMASHILVHAPYSVAITRHLASYFNNLRGDMEQSQTWLQNMDGLRKSSSSFSGYRSRLSVNLSSTRINELGGIQRLNSQRALQKVHSHALRGAVVFFLFSLIVSIVCVFYKYNPQTVEYITSETVNQATIYLSTFTISPLFSLFELMSNILSDCGTLNSKKFENLFNHMISPFNTGSEQIITALEYISQALKIVDNGLDQENTGYNTFSSILITDDNISLQLLMNQVAKLTEIVPSGMCQVKYLQYVSEYTNKISYCFEPLQTLKTVLYRFSSNSLDKFRSYYIRDYCILIIVLFIFLALSFIYIHFGAQMERKKFWSVLSELNDTDLENFQKQLLVVHEKGNEHAQMEETNALDVDEIDETDADHLISFNELIPLGKLKRKIDFFPSLTILFFLIFGVAMYCYKIPYELTLKIDMNLDYVSHSLQTTIAEHTFRVINYTYKALYNAIPLSSALLENSENDSNIDPRYKIKMLETDILPINENETSNGFLYDMDELLSNYYSYFIDAFKLEDQLNLVINETTKLADEWIIYQLDDNFFNMVWLTFHNVTSLSNQISEWFLEKHSKLNMMRTVCSHSLSLFLSFVLVGYSIIVIRHLREYQLEFEAFKALIIILPSPYFVSTASIIELFKRKVKKKVGSKRFWSRYIIKHSVNPIIVIDSNHLIQDLNKATIELLGFKRDVLIRTDIVNIFKRDDPQFSDFLSGLSLMNNQTQNNTQQQAQGKNTLQNQSLREFPLNAITNFSSFISVKCTLIPIQSNNEDPDSPAFAILLRDTTEFKRQADEIEKAKKNNKDLLHRIMPKVMVNKLLANENNLHFHKERATFSFIAIYNFVEWCKFHNHTEIMELLDRIVSAFDKRIMKFPTLVKIKIINGVYMLAGGLFEETDKPNEESEKPNEVEMVEFAIKCIKYIHKSFPSGIQLQIGINTGGPIVAGILGKDKPFFDVYGDAVNVAARLETSAEPDTIQISQETALVVKDYFQLKERQHVFLKGKGDATTYQVIIPEEALK